MHYSENIDSRLPRLQLASSPSPLLLLLVPQHSPEDLPGRRLWYYVDEFDTTANPLVSSFVLFDVFLDLTRKNAVVLLKADRGCLDDKGLWHFSGLLVRNLDHSAIVDSGMRQ